jgi:four helix bundle protein
VDAEDLKRRTRAFALAVIDLCTQLASDDVGRLVRPQLLRAAAGVASNYRAACRSRSPREFAARLGVVVEEVDESEFWLDMLTARGCSLPGLAIQRKEACELRAIFAKARSTTLLRLKSSQISNRNSQIATRKS